MIELVIWHPRQEAGEAESVAFEVKPTGGRASTDAIDLSDTEAAIREIISDRPEIISLDMSTAEHDLTTVTYDSSLTNWRSWYLDVVHVIQDHYRRTYPKVGYEVVSRIEALTDL